MEKLFRIIEITKELAGDIASKEYNPHFHDFEELIIISQGSLTHYIDFKVEVLKAPFAERNLNIICRNNFQKSVSEIIETRKLIEAKRMLLYSDKSVSEIGYELGYNEKSYFTRVFHSRMDITPTRFREMSKNIIT